MIFSKVFSLNKYFKKVFVSSVLISTTLFATPTVFAGGTLGTNSTIPPYHTGTEYPEIQATDIYYSTPLGLNKVILFDSGVINSGRLDVESFKVKWYINDKEVYSGTHNGIPRNSAMMYGNSELKYTFTTPGVYKITFEVDADNKFREKDENNNKKSVTICVFPVDIAPTPITCSIPYPKVGQRLVFNTSIQNIGYADSGIFNVTWYVNDCPVAAGSHNSVPGNTTVDDGNSQLDYTFGTPGIYKITVEVDWNNLVNEFFEGNNKTSIYVDVRNP